MGKREVFDAGAVWWKAILESDRELKEHVGVAEKDRRRFYGFRLLENLCKGIENSELDVFVGMFRCYSFITRMSGHGYVEPWRLHGEELKELGLRSAVKFCRAAQRLHKRDPFAFLVELGFRIESIASWIEAQISFSCWLVFQHCRDAWRGKDDERGRAIQAVILSRLPQQLVVTSFRGKKVKGAHLWEGAGIGTNYEGEPFDGRQWSNILKRAAYLAEKPLDCAPFESWLWWCYPVFSRYDWNTREVQDAAKQRGFCEGKMEETNFRRHLMSMGMRIKGRKQRRDRIPLLAKFVREVLLPDTQKVYGFVIWY